MRVNLIWGGPGAKSTKVTEMRQHFPPWNYWRNQAISLVTTGLRM